jgi:hypothetical protein
MVGLSFISNVREEVWKNKQSMTKEIVKPGTVESPTPLVLKRLVVGCPGSESPPPTVGPLSMHTHIPGE